MADSIELENFRYCLTENWNLYTICLCGFLDYIEWRELIMDRITTIEASQILGKKPDALRYYYRTKGWIKPVGTSMDDGNGDNKSGHPAFLWDRADVLKLKARIAAKPKGKFQSRASISVDDKTYEKLNAVLKHALNKRKIISRSQIVITALKQFSVTQLYELLKTE